FVSGSSAYQTILGGIDGIIAEGLNSNNTQRQLNVVDSVLLAKSRHQIKLGIDLRRLLPVYDPVTYAQAYIFGGVSGALSGIAAAAIVGSLSTANQFSHTTNVSAFGQDTWMATPRLSVTFGLRWELNPPPGLSSPSSGALTLASANPPTLAAPGTP